MGIGNRPFLPWVLEGDGTMQHMLKRHLHGIPDFPEEHGVKKLFCRRGVTHGQVTGLPV